MKPKAVNFIVAGVGGQGTLLASDILAEVGMHLGYDAKKSEVHGSTTAIAQSTTSSTRPTPAFWQGHRNW